MLLQELREQVSDYGKRMLADGLTKGTLGYVSARDPESGLICSSPSSMEYMKIAPSDVLVTDAEGNIMEGTGKVSSEWCVQRDFYKNNSHLHALVHTHSTFASTLSTLQVELPAAYFTVPSAGGNNVRCTGYHSFYSQELSDDIQKKMEGRKAVLMGNHGLLASGEDLKDAYNVAQNVEFAAEIYWRALCAGKPYILTDAEVERQIRELEEYRHTNDKK